MTPLNPSGYIEVQHTVGEDLTLSPTGDLAVSTGLNRTKERLLRRLITNAGEYVWHVKYGAGLPGYIGKALDPGQVKAVIRSQMAQEESVLQNPEPTISIVAIQNGVAVSIAYQDAQTNSPVTLSFNATA